MPNFLLTSRGLPIVPGVLVLGSCPGKIGVQSRRLIIVLSETLLPERPKSIFIQGVDMYWCTDRVHAADVFVAVTEAC